MVALFSLFTFCALAVETIIPRWLPIAALAPDLVLILAVDLGFRHHGAWSPVMAFAMGYAVDTFSGDHLGLNALMLTLVFVMAYEMSRYLMAGGTLIGVLAVFLGVMAKQMADFAVSSGGAASGQLGALLPAVLLQAAITAMLTPWIFAMLVRCKRMLGLPQRSIRE
ncbi:MAG: rod shape-determining protein MreD [Candidatus Binataceae bacterium]